MAKPKKKLTRQERQKLCRQIVQRLIASTKPKAREARA